MKIARPYQRAGIKALVSRTNFLLGDQVGLGKTFQVIKAAQELELKTILTVSPLNLKGWWKKEITELEEDAGFTVTVEELLPKTPLIKVTTQEGELVRAWVLSHYEQYINRVFKGKRIESESLKLFRSKVWGAVIVDEVHKIKSHKAKRTNGIIGIRAEHKWGLTGTPVAERPPDLWQLLNWVAPREFPNYWSFVTTYTVTERTRYGQVIKQPRNLESLRRRTEPFLLVRRREDVNIELPPMTGHDEMVPIDMTDEQEKMYKEFQESSIIDLSGEAEALGIRFDGLDFAGMADVPPLIINSAMARFTRLHQVASLPSHFRKIEGAKEAWLKDFVEGTDEPALVMARYRESAFRIRQLVPDTWLVDTYKALAHGHNLQHYHVFIAWDLTWERLEWEQALGRIERPGQEHPMTVYRLACVNTVDYDVCKAVDKKQSEVDMILEWLRRQQKGDGANGTVRE